MRMTDNCIHDYWDVWNIFEELCKEIEEQEIQK